MAGRGAHTCNPSTLEAEAGGLKNESQSVYSIKMLEKTLALPGLPKMCRVPTLAKTVRVENLTLWPLTPKPFPLPTQYHRKGDTGHTQNFSTRGWWWPL